MSRKKEKKCRCTFLLCEREIEKKKTCNDCVLLLLLLLFIFVVGGQ